MSSDLPPIIIRRKKVVAGHHGGAWKIALADFMTALMALFLVMWIIASADDAQRRAISEYFRAPLVGPPDEGSDSGQSSNVIPGGGPDPASSEGERMRFDPLTPTRPSARQRQRFSNLQQRIETAIAMDPDLQQLREQLRFDMTPEGLRIQMFDTEQRPMFDLGSDSVAPYMRDLLRTIAPLLNELPNKLSISGHTDSLTYAGGDEGYSNWELSSERANASRRELKAGGLEAEKLLRVSGYADRVGMPDTQPDDPINRRIEVLVLFSQVADQIRSPNVLETPDVPPMIGPQTSPAGENLPDGDT